MNRLSIALLGLAALPLAPAAGADTFWTGTLPRHDALCASGSSAKPEDLGRALDGFAAQLANKDIVTIGFPFVRSLTLSYAANGGAPASGAWEICAPAPDKVKPPAGFTARSIEAESVAALLCEPPIAGCAKKLLTKLDLPKESPRIASLRSTPLTGLEKWANFDTADRTAAILEVVRADTVRVDSPDPASIAASPALPIDADLAGRRTPRPLYVSPTLTGPATGVDREIAVLVTIAIEPPENTIAGSTRPSASNP